MIRHRGKVGEELVCQEPSTNGLFPGICGYPKSNHPFRHIFQPSPPPIDYQNKSDSSKSSVGGGFVLAMLTTFLTMVGLISCILAYVLYNNHGISGTDFPDLSPKGMPLLPSSALETVARLPASPGNLAVSSGGRIFFSFHPENGFPTKVAEWLPRENIWIPYPSESAQLTSVLSVRIHGQTLYALDYANFGLTARPKLVAYNLETNQIRWTLTFPWSVAGPGSMLNDFVISPDGSFIYIADTSILRGKPGVIMVDVVTKTAKRVLDNHASLYAKPFKLHIKGNKRPVSILGGLFLIRPAVDSIALSFDGATLYFSPVADTKLYSIPTSVVLSKFHARIDDAKLHAQIFTSTSKKTSSDGLTTDKLGRVYITDFENSAIQLFDPKDGSMTTLVQSALLRWPDGLSFGPDGWLYISCSALHEIWAGNKASAPFHILRVKTDTIGRIGQ
jgi:sugar lactone lactonase YvrE